MNSWQLGKKFPIPTEMMPNKKGSSSQLQGRERKLLIYNLGFFFQIYFNKHFIKFLNYGSRS